ncbi:DJ-1/PfpI family protein [Plectosphaerella cucumerina]|uniref:DJ-1/PfpI family protein n=1 Tax=Plectosphaerella cucumerina TaxID=40658 RepID=A0A8K0TDZ1_9PEZI|nr:DJ-1/PfpI family protein [Plectosphaerella cucumerina]
MLLRTILSLTAITASMAACQEPPVVRWGVLAMPGVDLLDVYGPIELLYIVAGNLHLDVKIITPTTDNVVITPPLGNRFNSTYQPEIVGQATFDDDLDLDVLVVPGGAVARDPNTLYIDEYLIKMFPRVRHFVTICTGAIFAARAGLFDNRRATTNKAAWNLVTAHGENVTWVAPARYVRDGNVWSSSGVTAGMDLTLYMIKEFYGEDLQRRIRNGAEILPRAWDDDPFTDIVGVPHQGH